MPVAAQWIRYYVCINDCIIDRNSGNAKYADLNMCPVCNESRYYKSKRLHPKRTFSYIPVGPRLARLYGERNLAKLIQSHPGDEYDEDIMWDIHHSPAWKELYSADGHFHGDKMGIALAFDMDGINPFHDTGILYSMTPMMLTILNLPRHIRNTFGYINLVGIIPGNGKSEAKINDPYVEVLVDELLYLTKWSVHTTKLLLMSSFNSYCMCWVIQPYQSCSISMVVGPLADATGV